MRIDPPSSSLRHSLVDSSPAIPALTFYRCCYAVALGGERLAIAALYTSYTASGRSADPRLCCDASLAEGEYQCMQQGQVLVPPLSAHALRSHVVLERLPF